jgi:hypothetical protein
MRKLTVLPLLMLLSLLSFACGPIVRAQDAAPGAPPAAPTAPPPPAAPAKPPTKVPHAPPPPAVTDSQKNVQAYVELLRSNVRQEKAEMMGAVMQLSAADAAKFWPIYSEYNEQLTKLNNLRVANIQDYVQNYSSMTDEKADQLIQNAFDYRKQRAELEVKTYGQMKQALGPVTAARFLQVEDQLLLIIDLQIDAALPIVGEAQ